MAKSAKRYGIHLQLLQYPFILPNIDRVLHPIGEAIEICIHDIETVDYESITDYDADAIIDEETDVIENLLGTAFVVCQTYISSVISRVRILHRLYKKEHNGAELTTTSITKPDILAFGSSSVGSSDFSEVQVIDAFANYFKHRAEWVRVWDKLPKKDAYTARIIGAVGASRGSTGNLRTGAKVLGNEVYSNMDVFVGILQRWRQNLYNGYREELGVETSHFRLARSPKNRL